jgi:phosphoglucosamine mutase
VLKLFTSFPQILKNVRLSPSLLKLPEVENVFEEARLKLGTNGRLVVRASGTEPLIRIMAEAENLELTEEVVDHISTTLTSLAEKVAA